jgi:hypothetical protein
LPIPHPAFERFLANHIRDNFGPIGSPSGSKPAPETKRIPKNKPSTQLHPNKRAGFGCNIKLPVVIGSFTLA